ncbi:hypothetical protein BDV95DRAFT_286382 [Massariosphaeria phaeospora]|uniref:Uncharacterized protein n=1 Tax=Massariosphaeria phaeospora TaxID=100035 RepID=A0A7C8IFJ4_9PLEO|nr:hypothetical protein BDV95DRAFT_286382 [Massariosphaeria phaeospora]
MMYERTWLRARESDNARGCMAITPLPCAPSPAGVGTARPAATWAAVPRIGCGRLTWGYSG